MTPHYTAPGCRGTEYCSQILVGENSAIGAVAEAHGGVCAINRFESHSGMNALRALVAPLRGQMLHAAVLGFIHPRTDEYVRFRRPPHAEMMNVIRGLRTFAGMDPDAPGPWDRETT